MTACGWHYFPDWPRRRTTWRKLRRFGPRKRVAGVSLRIARGEFFTMLGPSGSGKTTTLRLIAGFEQAGGGRVELGGEDVTGRPP
ncbi:MAG: ATP-binding cassette domain-containing protein, partial [Solirubrobacteraceae bacterium]